MWSIRSSVPLRSNLSPRHVPDEIHALPSIPTTLSGKKLELPVKKILRGADPDSVASRGALKNPESLDAVASPPPLPRRAPYPLTAPVGHPGGGHSR